MNERLYGRFLHQEIKRGVLSNQQTPKVLFCRGLILEKLRKVIFKAKAQVPQDPLISSCGEVVFLSAI